VANLAVKALNTATNVETASATTTAGVYRMPYLPPDTYRLSASAPGFTVVPGKAGEEVTIC